MNKFKCKCNYNYYFIKQDTPKGLESIKNDLGDLDSKINKKMETEVKERREADEELKDDIDRILGRRDATVPSLVSRNLPDGIDCANGVRYLVI